MADQLIGFNELSGKEDQVTLSMLLLAAVSRDAFAM